MGYMEYIREYGFFGYQKAIRHRQNHEVEEISCLTSNRINMEHSEDELKKAINIKMYNF